MSNLQTVREIYDAFGRGDVLAAARRLRRAAGGRGAAAARRDENEGERKSGDRCGPRHARSLDG